MGFRLIGSKISKIIVLYDEEVSEKNWDIAELQKIISDRLRMVSEPHEPPGGSYRPKTF